MFHQIQLQNTLTLIIHIFFNRINFDFAGHLKNITNKQIIQILKFNTVHK